MTQASIGSKSMTSGEALLAPLFIVLAFLCVIAAALAHDGAFAFHTALGAIASLGAAFTIINR
jgi:cytochrome c oxidase cbb3-type subunit I